MPSSALDILIIIGIGLFVVAWPVCLILAAQRGQWIWFVAMLFIWFLPPLYFFQIAADRRNDKHERVLSRRKQERSRTQAKELASLRREVSDLKEKLG